MTLKGTEDCVEKAQAAVRGLVDEAARCAVEVALNGALEKCLSRPPLLKLQEVLECALVADKATDPPTLSLRGRADAVATMKLALERDYDVDEHEREMTARTIPVVIGSGATIKRFSRRVCRARRPRVFHAAIKAGGGGEAGRRRRRRPRRFGVRDRDRSSPARSG